MKWSDAVFMLPEIVLTIGASLLLVAPVLGKGWAQRSAKWVMLGVLAATAITLVICSNAVVNMTQTRGFGQMFALDAFSIFFKMLFIVVIAMIALLSEDFLRESRYSTWEYYSLMAFALLGMMFMASGVHLISIYIGLELMSLSSYILAGYFKDEQKSTEAAMKYFVLGALASGLLLYGMSMIYGATGTLEITQVAR